MTSDIVSFVNISTGEFYDYKSWDEISALGGLVALFPKEQWDDIFNERAAAETYNSVMSCCNLIGKYGKIPIYSKNIYLNYKDAILFIEPYKKAINLFKRRIDGLNSK